LIDMLMLPNLAIQFGALEHQTYATERVLAIARFFRECSNQRRALPFDPYECAHSLGLRVYEKELARGESGQLRLDLPQPIIEVNRTDSHLRKRYTVCHELAHLCFTEKKPALPGERGEIDRIPDVQRREERLCDRIAAELLMPKAVFLKHAKMSLPSFDALSSLTETFGVSLSSALFRLREVRAWTLGVREYEFDESERTLRRRSGWTTVCRAIRSNHERWKVCRQVDQILETSERFLQNNQQRLTGRLTLRFRGFDIRFLLIDARRKAKAIALKQS
jgi:Zn-dependent peptidase ImmA (M78 family)